MQLTIRAEGHSLPLEVPDDLITEAEEFFSKLDRDMDRGWQMSLRWVEQPQRDERCQIVSDQLLNAMHQGNAKLGMLLAAYILSRRPGTISVQIDDRDMNETSFS